MKKLLNFVDNYGMVIILVLMVLMSVRSCNTRNKLSNIEKTTRELIISDNKPDALLITMVSDRDKKIKELEEKIETLRLENDEIKKLFIQNNQNFSTLLTIVTNNNNQIKVLSEELKKIITIIERTDE